MKNLQTFKEFLNESSLNEGSFKDLQAFLDDVISVVQKNNKSYSLEKNRGIILDTVGEFGFKTETIVVNFDELANDLKSPINFAENIVFSIFNKYKTALRKGTTRNGNTYITYKK